MKIKSKIDVITNSSSEVFCYKVNDPEYKELKKSIPDIDFAEFKTFDDIKKFVTSEDYFGWPFSSFEDSHGEICPEPTYDLYDSNNEEFIKELKESGKTEQDIWDFLK